MARRLKLMAEIQCWALWDMDNLDNIEPDTLPLSEQLISDLNEWSDQFDLLYDLNDPNFDYSAPLFKTEADENRFFDSGWSLYRRLKAEAPEIEWWYRDMRYSELMQQLPAV